MRIPFYKLAGAFAGLAVVGPVRAQAIYQLGPQVSLGAGFSAYREGSSLGNGRLYHTLVQPGFEAGLVGSVAFGRVAVQPALLFARRGLRIDDTYTTPTYLAETQATLRLSYLTLPLNVAYSLRADGQGWQLAAGPYVGLLLGGRYTFHNHYAGYRLPESTTEGDVPVAGSPAYHQTTVAASLAAPTTYYSRRLDAGFQVGVGYRAGASLLRLSFSQGLLNQGVGARIDYGGPVGVYNNEPPTHYTQALQVSYAYLLGPKS
jgi:hypothetical protein